MSSHFTQHPLSAAFPSMDEKDFAALVADIRANGQRHPIMLFEDQVIDGWHRCRACEVLDKEIIFERLQSGIDPVGYVQSMNLHRRHLTGSQRAAAVVACSQWAPSHRPEKAVPGTGLPVTNENLASIADVGESTIRHAKRAHEAGLGEAVRDGKVTAKQAAQIAKLPEEQRQAAIEAPPKPEPKEAKAKGDDAEVARLKARIAELEERVAELNALLDEVKENNESLTRTLDAEDLLGQFQEEVTRYQRLAHVTEGRNKSLQIQYNMACKDATRWMRRAQSLEKQLQGAKDEDGPELSEADDPEGPEGAPTPGDLSWFEEGA